MYNNRRFVPGNKNQAGMQIKGQMQSALANISSKIEQPNSQRRSRDDDFEKLTKLGQGSFGVVYTVRRK